MKKKPQHRTKPSKLRRLFTANRHVQPDPDQGHAEHDDAHASGEETPAAAPPHVEPIQSCIGEPEAEQPYRTTRQEAKPAEPDRHTRWLQAWLPLAISLLTLIVITAHAYFYNKQWRAMVRQSDIMGRQSELMAKQLETMNSGSQQTERLIKANESLAEQNRELVGHAGEQANASQTLAKASTAQAESMKQLAGATESSASAANIQAEITQQSTAAFVEFNNWMRDPDWERQIVEVEFANTGRVAATDFEAEVEVTRLTLPDQRVTVSETFKVGGNRSYIGTNRPFIRGLKLRGASMKDAELVSQTKEAVVLKGHFSYMNGFNKRISRSFCTEYLALHFANPQRGSERGWRFCDDVPRLLEAAIPPTPEE